MLKFVLLVNKQGQTRLSQYYEYVPVEERVTTEADIVRKCLARNEEAVSEFRPRQLESYETHNYSISRVNVLHLYGRQVKAISCILLPVLY